MTRKSKPGKRKLGKVVPPASTAPKRAADEGDGPLSSSLTRLWAKSRHGATSGRGYHYQDLVGAWVALHVLTGDIEAGRVIAEGLEDLTCEGNSPQQVQVKSRQERVGDFRTAQVARFVVEVWQRRSLRIANDADESAVVVVERAVDGYAPHEWARRLNDDVRSVDLVTAIRQHAQESGIAAEAVDLLIARTTVVVLPQQRIYTEAAERVAAHTGLPLGATLPVVQALRAAVAEHADRNAEVGWDQRVGLSRTDIERIVTETAALVDRESLAMAVANGVCEPIDFDTPLTDPEFYSGAGTQPGHIAAGLVIPRPAAVDEVLAGLGSGRAVLIAGPSGIGKSAVLWMAAYVARHVVWYRVHRLGVDDVEPLIRLAAGAGAGRHGPVGFVVDGVGTGSLRAWDELHRRAAAIAGVLLLGSVREEDILPLQTFGECVTVRPRLDEDLADLIHKGLLESGATTQPHWREAYSRSNGLTLEFTHLLSQGRRLRDVIRDQVQQRVRDHRAVELAVIAPVSVADRWGAALPFTSLAEIVTGSAGEFKEALTRLTDEHLITVDDGVVRGLHPVRSAALCEAVHEVPPPIASTIRDVIKRIDTDHLSFFVARAISDDPILAPAVVDSLTSRLDRSPGDLATMAGALAGLRLADFTQTARRWAAVLDRHDVPVPHRPVGLSFAMFGSELVEGLDPRLVAAIEEIRHDPASGASALRDEFLRRIGVNALNDVIYQVTSASEVSALLAPLAGTGAIVAPPPSSAPLRSALRNTPLADISELIATARNVSTAAGAALLEAAGGSSTIIERLKQDHPYLLDLSIVDDGDRVLRGRVLHVADRFNPDPEKAIKELAGIGLRCLPDVDRADLTTILARGLPMRVNGHELAVSGLLRRYALTENEVAWNRTRSRFARSLVAATSTTERLAAGLAVLEDCARFLADLAEAWVTGRRVGQRLEALDRQRALLLQDIDALAPEQANEPLAGPVDQTDGLLSSDPIYGIAQGIARNLASRLDDSSRYAAVAAFAGDTIINQLDDARREPWTLLGLDGSPPVLDRLATALHQLAAVLVERALGDTSPSQIMTISRSMPRGKGLARAASLTRARAQRRYEEILTALVEEAAARGLQLETRTRPHPDPKIVTWPPMDTAVLVHLRASNLNAAIETLTEIVGRFTLPGSSLVVIPVQDGVPLLRCTVRLFTSGQVYPLPEEAQPWLDLIPPTKPMICSDAVADVVAALSELSSLAWLDAQRSVASPMQEAVDATVTRFRGATARLSALPRDEVIAGLIEEIDGLIDRVQREIDDQATAGEFAEAIASGLTSDSNDALIMVSGLVHIAMQWDLDPAGARAFLASLS